MSDQLLHQIFHELKEAKQERREMNSEIGGMGTKISGLDSKINDMESEMNNRFDQLEVNVAHIQEDVTDVKASVNRIEKNEPKDILAMLETINNKLDDKGSDIGVLNKRLFTVESSVERIKNQ